ncbi:MAG: ribosome assembly factor SBDS [Nanoarchaeota archaeon]
MTQTTARIKQKGKHFEIIVDLDRALKFKKGQSTALDFLEADVIFTDSKKGFHASEKDLTEAFGINDASEIAKKIVKSGEILITQEHREEEKDKKIKQVIDFLSRNAIDPKTMRPHTPDRIKTAIEQAHVNIKNVPVENQIKEIMEQLSKVLPIKMEEKRYVVTIPSIYTGQAYGIISPYKEQETWMNNGDLRVNVHVPSGLAFQFFDKLNSVTHGSVVTEELKEKGK